MNGITGARIGPAFGCNECVLILAAFAVSSCFAGLCDCCRCRFNSKLIHGPGDPGRCRTLQPAVHSGLCRRRRLTQQSALQRGPSSPPACIPDPTVKPTYMPVLNGLSHVCVSMSSVAFECHCLRSPYLQMQCVKACTFSDTTCASAHPNGFRRSGWACLLIQHQQGAVCCSS